MGTELTSVAPRTSAVERRIEDLRARSGEMVRPLGTAPMPNGPQLFIQPPSSPWNWILLRLEDDPLYRTRELEMPKHIKQHLRQLDAAGVRFDDLLIAHEVAKTALSKNPKPGEVAKAIIDSPIPATRQREMLSKVFGSMRTGALAALVAPLAPVALAAAAIGSADPALIGVIAVDGKPRPGVMAAYFLVAQW